MYSYSPERSEAIRLFQEEIDRSQKNNYFDHNLVLENGGCIPIFFENMKNRLLERITIKTHYKNTIDAIEIFPKFIRLSNFPSVKSWKRFEDKALEFSQTWKTLDAYLMELDTFPESYEELSSVITELLTKQKKLYTPKLVPALITYRAFETKKEFCNEIQDLVKNYQEPMYSHEEEFQTLFPELTPALKTPHMTSEGRTIDAQSARSRFSTDVAHEFKKRQEKYPEKSREDNLKDSYKLVTSRAHKLYGEPAHVELIAKVCRASIEEVLLG